MQSMINTMTAAGQLMEAAGQPLSFENTCIRNMFILPSRIKAFGDDELYLSFIGHLIRECGNYAFPETAAEYDRYFADCIRLKEQMQPFDREVWLSCTSLLFENLKTPFYGVYAGILLDLESCFSDRDLFLRTLKDFYSVLIKSSPEVQKLTGRIASLAAGLRPYFSQNEPLLSDLLRSRLSCFAGDKNIWLVNIFQEMYTDSVSSLDEIHVAAFLEDYHKKELHFLTENVPAPEDILARRAPGVPGISAPDAAHGAPGSTFSISALTLPEYLARRAFFFAARKTAAPKDVFARYKKAGGFLTLSKDSILNRFAYNMTSASYLTDPAIGREAELKDLELILISPKKSPILLGEAGVGKTAVVEGLAWRLQQGMVPSLLQNKEIYKLTTTSLLSGTKYVGEMEERIRQLMEELDRHPDILLFIDEIHTIVGAGSTESSNNDISNMLKPYIDRGDIKIIGSTTSAEYNQYLLSDKALARRFYPITVEEPDEETTMQILLGTLPATEQETRVRHTFSDKELRQILGVLIHLSHKEYQPADRRTRRPELPLTLLEMAFSFAALQSRETVATKDFISAVRHSNLLRSDVRQRAEEFF